MKDFNVLATIQFGDLLSSLILSKKLKIKMYKIVISPVVLHGCEGV
jgi:hypothetical protein